MADRLPREVTDLVGKHIHGLTQLELLIFIHDHPTTDMTAAAAARELRMSEEQTGAVLHDLHSRGFLDVGESTERSYRYLPHTKELARQVDVLAETWPRYRHSIISLIFSKPPESVTNFADAFRLRKDDQDG